MEISGRRGTAVRNLKWRGAGAPTFPGFFPGFERFQWVARRKISRRNSRATPLLVRPIRIDAADARTRMNRITSEAQSAATPAVSGARFRSAKRGSPGVGSLSTLTFSRLSAGAHGQPRARVPDVVASRSPRPYHFRARIQSFQAVAAPFPGDLRVAARSSRGAILATETPGFKSLRDLPRDGGVGTRPSTSPATMSILSTL